MKIRIKFAKEGNMKFIGHLDVMRYFQKVMRKADVDIRYSEGFSPHQIMSFAAPLGVGITSRGEYVDIEVISTDSSKEMLRRMNEVAVEGIEFLNYRKLPDTAASAMSLVAAADYTVTFREGKEPEDWEAFAAGLAEFARGEQILVMKQTKKGEKETDIRPMIYSLTVDGQAVHMKIATGSAANLKPDVVIRAYMDSVGLALEEFALLVHRDEVYGSRGNKDQVEPVALDQFGGDIE